MFEKKYKRFKINSKTILKWKWVKIGKFPSRQGAP